MIVLGTTSKQSPVDFSRQCSNPSCGKVFYFSRNCSGGTVICPYCGKRY